MNDKTGLTSASGAADSRKSSDRRRSQRSLLVMPLALSWTTSTGMRVREHAETEVVSASGAMLRMKTRVPNNSVVDLKRPATNQSASVKVVSVSNPGPDGWVRVAVEFTSPNTSFWGITFPPIEETPAEEMPPAKPTLASLLASRSSVAPKPGNLGSTSYAKPATPPAQLPAALIPVRMGAK